VWKTPVREIIVNHAFAFPLISFLKLVLSLSWQIICSVIMNFVMKKSLFSHFLCLHAGTWECPDVFEIKAAATKDGSSGDEENEDEETRFVLKANTAQGSACHGGPNNWWAVGQFVAPEELPAAAVASTDGAFKPTSTVRIRRIPTSANKTHHRVTKAGSGQTQRKSNQKTTPYVYAGNLRR
jgi:hypothetical protein